MTALLAARHTDNLFEQIQDLKKISAPVIYENIYTIPNILTFSRLALAPVIGYLIIRDSYSVAMALFVVSGITDMVSLICELCKLSCFCSDMPIHSSIGAIARRFNLKTIVGSVVDPLADKVLMTILTVALASKALIPGKFDARMMPLFHSYPALNTRRFLRSLAALIVGRDFALGIAAVFIRYKSLPAPVSWIYGCA